MFSTTGLRCALLVFICFQSRDALRLTPEQKDLNQNGVDIDLMTVSEYWNKFGKQNMLLSKVKTWDECLMNTPLVVVDGERSTMKQQNKFIEILKLARDTSEVHGDIAMAGIAGGGDAYGVIFYLACREKLGGRKVHLFDTWEGLPGAQGKEDDGFKQGAYHITYERFLNFGEAYGNKYDSYTGIKGSWIKAMAHAVTYKGLFADTMPDALSGSKLALLSCDGDMYGSTMDCLNGGASHLVPGAVVYQDDYYSFIGNYMAVQRYREEKNISDGISPIFVVPFTAEVEPIKEDRTMCVPPKTNEGGKQGNCQGIRYEAGYWFQRET